MKVFVEMSGKIYDVAADEDGNWTFMWTDCGKGQSHTYHADAAEMHTRSGAWKVLEEVKAPNYAAAFNAWMQDYINDPQAYESIYDTAMRHVSEKLGGYEASYGEVCAEVLVNYLNKLESK